MDKKYQIIYADPPWEYTFPHTGKRNGFKDYPIMKLDDLYNLPINTITEDNAVLLIWVNNPLLPSAFSVIKAWGFEYKTIAFSWVKTYPNSMGIWRGMGHYTRSNAELCLLCTKGKPLKVQSHNISSVIISELTKHSHKPSIVRERIVELFGDLPRIELFARQKVSGWSSYGNEVESDIIL